MPKRTRIQNLKEFVLGSNPKHGKVIISKMQAYGTRPSSTFKDMVEVFEKDAIVRESIVHMAMEVVSGGIFTTINDNYKLTLPNGDGESWNAKEAIDYWNLTNNMDEKLLSIAIELIGYGNSFLYTTPTGLKFINIESIGRALEHKKNVPIIEEYDIELTGTYYGKKLKWGEFIHFRSNVTSSSEPFGTGVVTGLIESYDSDTPTLLEVRNSIRESMKGGFERFGQPNEVYSFPELGDEKLDKVAKDIKAMSNKGNRLTVNTKASIENSLPERVRGYDEWVKQMFDEFIMALGNPSLKASIESGFTEASIRGSIELFQKKVQSIRRIIKRLVEELWNNVLTEYGFDPKQAQVRLNFGSEEVEFTTVDIMNAFEKGVITREEARTMLREKIKWKLESEEIEEEPTPEPEPEPIPVISKESLKESKEAELVDVALKEKKLKLMDTIMRDYESDR